MHSSSQLPVLLSLVILFSFAVLSEKIGLESVLGAFSSGMILRLETEGEQGVLFREKLDANLFRIPGTLFLRLKRPETA